MRKALLILTAILGSFHAGFSQPNLVATIPNPNTLAANRTPNGTSAYAYVRHCSLILPSELTILPAGTSLTSFGFTVSTGTNGVPVTGNFTLYLQNTADATYQKGTTWSTIPTGMQLAYANTLTVPGAAGTASVMVTLSSSFTYTGGGLYVAYDWYTAGPYATTAANFLAETGALNPGGATQSSPSSAPATLLSSPLRPSFLFGCTNPYANDAQVITVVAPGKVVNSFSNPQNVSALVKNTSNGGLNNINVTLNVSGANAYTNTQTITTLASGASTMVTFSAFTPTGLGINNVAVSVPTDDFGGNNLATYSQSVSCDTWAQNPIGTYTSLSVGFNTGSGIIATTITNPVNTTLTAVKAAISTNAPSVGNSVYGVLLSSTGVVIATTSTFVITNAMLGTFQGAAFTTPQILTGGTTYYYGFAQTANATGYYPAGTFPSIYVDPNLYVYTGLTGGALTPLGSNFGYFGLEAIFQTSLNVSAASQTVVCGSTATLNALSTANYSWSTGATTSTIAVTPTVNTTYTITTTNGACSASNTAVVSISPLPLTTTSQTVICGNTATLNAVSPTNYSWTTGATTSSIAVTPSINTVYFVTATNSAGCSSTKSASVAVNPLLVTAAASSSAICLNSPVTLTATGATSYLWSTSTGTVSSNSTFTDSPAQTISYYVTGTNTLGCTAIGIVTVLVNGLPNVAISSLFQEICLGNAIILSASGALTYTWGVTGAPTTPTVSSSPTATTIYTVIGTDLNGCANYGTTTITVNSVTLSVTGSTAICSGKTGSLIVDGADTYLWNGTAPFAEYHVTPTVTTTYSVTGTNVTTGCTGSTSISLIVNPKPPVQATSSKTVICTGESLGMHASGADSYTWTGSSVGGTAALNASITVFPAIATTNVYTVTGVDNNGCVNTATLALRTDACTGIQQTATSEKNISVFPNPNNGHFTVSFKTMMEGTGIEIYNSLGSLVFRQTCESDETDINLEYEANGVYLMYVTDKNKVISVSKIIRQ